MSSVAQVTDNTFDTEVMKSATPVLVDFYTTWCGPCKVLAPVIDQIAKEMTGKLKVVKVNVEEAQDTAASFGITSVPTLVIFKKGKEVARRVGTVPKSDLVAEIGRAL